MSTPQVPAKQPVAPQLEQSRISAFIYHSNSNKADTLSLPEIAGCIRNIPSNWRYFQAMLISAASKKRKDAVERGTVIEDVLE